MPSGKLCYCHHKIITFKNGTPSPIAIKGCEFSNDGKHHFVPIGAERNVDSSVRNAIEWIGFAVGIIAGLSCFIMKIIQ